MPLKPYLYQSKWYARGRIVYNGRPISDYIRKSTGATTEAGARDWIREKEEQEIRRYLIGETTSLTFSEATALYNPDPTTAKYLIPIVQEIGNKLLSEISPKELRTLGAILYPNNATDTWRRWVITPARSVINNAHDLGKAAPIVVKGYTKAERVAQDIRRGKKSRVPKKAGDWNWLLQFREHAGPYHAALAHFMFATGARVGQATEMHPKHLDLQNAKAIIPAAKGHDDEEFSLPMELVVELANLPAKYPRGHRRVKPNLRVFGFASRCGPLKGWQTACKRAGIEYLPPHSAGRHGFGQEHVVRQKVDKQAVAKVGRWADVRMLDETYTHPEDEGDKIMASYSKGRVKAERETGLKVLKDKR